MGGNYAEGSARWRSRGEALAALVGGSARWRSLREAGAFGRLGFGQLQRREWTVERRESLFPQRAPAGASRSDRRERFPQRAPASASRVLRFITQCPADTLRPRGFTLATQKSSTPRRV